MSQTNANQKIVPENKNTSNESKDKPKSKLTKVPDIKFTKTYRRSADAKK